MQRPSSSTSSKKSKKKIKNKKRKKVKISYASERAVVTVISLIRAIAQAFDVNISGMVERGSHKVGFAPIAAMRYGDTQRHLLRTGRLLLKYGKRGKLPVLPVMVDCF